jgi:hypothetical protein
VYQEDCNFQTLILFLSKFGGYNGGGWVKETLAVRTDKGIIIFKVLMQGKFWEEDKEHWLC